LSDKKKETKKPAVKKEVVVPEDKKVVEK